MPYKDLREFLDRLEDENQLVHVREEVDWNLEIGAITKRLFDLRGPAPLFENIKDHPGKRLVSGLLGPSNPITARYALALEIPKDTTPTDIMEEFLRRMKNPIKPRLVKNGPCKENVKTGEDVDILEFPSPIVHEGDGGRYIGTWHTNITKDSDTGWVNWGTYRMMVYDKKTTAVSYGPARHIRSHLEKYRSRGENMPMATAIGTEPACAIASGTSIGYGLDEVDLAGGLKREPVDLVKCETIDLEVPATAEIVLEGEVSINETQEEGPFGEYHGYMGSKTIAPVYHVKCITYRDNPIMTASNMSTPIHDSAVLSAISSPAEVLNLLRNSGYPVKAISTLFLPNLYVVSCKKTHTHMAEHIAYTIWGASRGRVCTHLIVVGEDIDVNDPYQVLWAFCTRVDPARDIFVAPHVTFPQLTPFPLDEVEKGIGKFACYDAEFPYYWPEEWKKKPLSFELGYPKETQNKAKEKIAKFLTDKRV